MNILLLNERTVVLVDTHVNDEPTAEQIAEFTRMAAQAMRRMNLAPRSRCCRVELRLGQLGLGREDAPRAGAGAPDGPDLEIDGEMHGDCALDEALRLRILPSSTLRARPICWCVRTWTRATSPTTCSRRRPAATWRWVRSCWARTRRCILTSSSTVRRIINMTAMTVLDANRAETSA